MTGEAFPIRFGSYLLTAFLGQDALGRVYRALRVSGERGFVRLRVFDSPEISEDAVLDAIEENGEIHSFLKNPAIARGVQMDAVEGVPFLAWNEPNGRTLDALTVKAGGGGQGIPIEHALLISEKIATALDHAFNTTVDGERTLHGLVWPGFVSVSDDGEIRVTGFGLASGFLPSLGRPGFDREVGPYLAPEERSGRTVLKNSDVFSVGVILFELLFGRLPSTIDPDGDVKSASLQGPTIPPEVVAVLRTCLSSSETRYQSSGELRRELGKILFSGPYSPSTFNLAFFLSGLFDKEIEAENRSRAEEADLDLGRARVTPLPPSLPPRAPTPASRPGPTTTPSPPKRRAPYTIGGALLLIAALAGTAYLIVNPPRGKGRVPARPVLPRATPLPLPTPEPTSAPTTAMSEGQFKEEVARRVATELKKLEGQMKAAAKEPQPAIAPTVEPTRETPRRQLTAEAAPVTAPPRPEPTVIPTVAPPAPTAPAKPRVAPVDSATIEEIETPPKILSIVKPIYPLLALRARIKGTVLLQVLVSETGKSQEIRVLKSASGGLTESAVSAVRKWTFEPARRNGQPVKAWLTIPIPFEP